MGENCDLPILFSVRTKPSENDRLQINYAWTISLIYTRLSDCCIENIPKCALIEHNR